VSFVPTRQLDVWLCFSRRIRVGRLASTRAGLLFEYDSAFLQSGLELSPLRLPLQRGVWRGDARVFEGLPGVFDDALPDGWGRLLLERRVRELGLEAGALGPLDRLAFLSDQAMGALAFEPSRAFPRPTVVSLPSLEREAQRVFSGRGRVDLEQLLALGGSPQGARPKVLIQRRGALLQPERGPRAGWTSWLVKFRARDDERDAARVERLWMQLAQECGLEVAECELLPGGPRHPGYFATRRFDRVGRRRLHLHSLAGLLHVPSGVHSLDYRELLRVTRALTRDEGDVTRAYQLACFNVLAGNRDDHARNVAFLFSERGAWRLAPAYDVTPSHGPGGEHSMSVCGEGRPGRRALERLATEAHVIGADVALDAVVHGLRRFEERAEAAGFTRPQRRRLRGFVSADLT
jgi:serine/threonine-protein kinase HipA